MSGDVTQLLGAWNEGDDSAIRKLTPLIYGELRRVARARRMGERLGHTIQTTALVHEAWCRLAGQDGTHWQSREHFFAVASQLMRRILVDYARRRMAARRGGLAIQVPLDPANGFDVPAPANEAAPSVIALHHALEKLAALDVRKARMIELRFFGGLSIEETAGVLGVSQGTVMRDWTLAKAWLQREIYPEVPHASDSRAMGQG